MQLSATVAGKPEYLRLQRDKTNTQFQFLKRQATMKRGFTRNRNHHRSFRRSLRLLVWSDDSLGHRDADEFPLAIDAPQLKPTKLTSRFWLDQSLLELGVPSLNRRTEVVSRLRVFY